MDTSITTDPTGADITTTTTAAEETSPKEEEQQDGRFSFAEIYTYIRDGRYPSNFTNTEPTSRPTQKETANFSEPER